MLVIRQFYENCKKLEKFQWLKNGSCGNCLQRIANNVSIVASHCLQDTFKRPFWTGLLLVMRNASFIIMLSVVASGQSRKQTYSAIERRISFKNITLSSWWNIQETIHDEQLAINSDLSSFGLKTSILNQQKKRIILHYDNSRPHITRLTKDLLEDLGENCFILHILLTMHLLIVTCLGVCRTISESQFCVFFFVIHGPETI